jgi:hypothetical protein
MEDQLVIYLPKNISTDFEEGESTKATFSQTSILIAFGVFSVFRTCVSLLVWTELYIFINLR